MTPLKTLMKLSVILVEDVTTKKVPLLYPITHQRKQYCSDKNAVLQVLILTSICFVHYFPRVILLSYTDLLSGGFFVFGIAVVKDIFTSETDLPLGTYDRRFWGLNSMFGLQIFLSLLSFERF